jgi:zinc transport system substrate-binding protein
MKHLAAPLRRTTLVPGAAVALALTLTACSPGASGEATADRDRVQVLASFYPLEFVAERVGGAEVVVSSLTPAGAEPHDLELSPAQVRTVSEADVVLLLGGFQPAVDEAVAARAPERLLDAAEVLDLPAGAEADPHFWLDPTELAAMAGPMAEVLSEVRPDLAAEFAARADDLELDLAALDAQFREGLASCESRVFVTTHDAFGHLAERYDLEQVPISGLEPEAQPSPARLRDVAAAVEDEDVTTIFYETLVSPKVAEVLADDLGVRTAVLDPVEGLVDDDEDYLSVMRANLEALRAALRCA